MIDVEYKFEISAWLFQFNGNIDKYDVNQIEIIEEIINIYFFIILFYYKYNNNYIFFNIKVK